MPLRIKCLLHPFLISIMMGSTACSQVSSGPNTAARTETSAKPAEATRPNIVLVMADDLGWADVSYQSDTPIKTPNLDSMSKNSLIMSRFYSASPVCSPTRGSVMTGRHPDRFGITNANRGHLLAEEITLPEILGDVGYRTGHFGKWHLGTLSPDFSGKGKKRKSEINYMTPGMAGFDEWFSTEYSIATFDPYKEARLLGTAADGKGIDWRRGFYRNGETIKTALSGSTAKIVMGEALQFINRTVDQNAPFFAVVWLHAPHAPVVGDPEVMQRLYADNDKDAQHYYSAVTSVDTAIGALRTQLSELGVAENTLIVFNSDNGPEGAARPRNRLQGASAPFRGRKRSLYEGGVRVPGLVEWPARITESRTTIMPVVTSDILPTILDAVDVTLPTDRPYDGASFLDVIDGADRTRKQAIGFQYIGYSTWVTDRYKLVHSPSGKRHKSDTSSLPISVYELYDLKADPSETNNIADDNPAIVTRLRSELETWQKSVRRSASGGDYDY